MTYWHMQLHPHNDKWDEEKKLLKKLSLIGLGVIDNNYDNSQNKNFIKDMKIGDIVLIRHGATSIALVEILGEVEDINENNHSKLDWFRYRRKVKVLEYAENMASFPQPRGTLQKSINKYTRTYQYIDNWYKKYLNPKESNVGLKIRKVSIEDYKMFKDFDINFLDKDNKPLPMVVIAGKNGTGKTTLLECIQNQKHCSVDFQLDSSETYADNIIYLDALIQNDKELEELILDYIDYFIYDRNENAVIGVENLQADMDEVFDGFDLSFHFKKIDYKTKKPIFGNENSIRDDIEFTLKDLSTGERTLLSKVLYLHLKEPKNKVLLIDEPETSLHPGWQNRILKFYENFARINNNQIIIATHSPQIIASAKNEWIRVLTEDGVINNILAYGRDIKWVLKEMGVESSRVPEVLTKIEHCKKLLEDDNYDEAEQCIDEIENIIGSHDSEIVALRTSLEFWRE